jgi:site-specific DNA-cytosine methylase
MKGFTYFTLFGGAGVGTSRLKEIGGISLGSIELSEEQQELWVLNNIEAPNYSPQSVQNADLPLYIDFLQASPPCIHSSGAKRNGTVSASDKEQEEHLFKSTLYHFARVKPQLFVLENVPAYFTKQRVEWLDQFAELGGYSFQLCKCSGTDFGLPISRARGFAVLSKEPLKPFYSSLQPASVEWPDLLSEHLEPETRGLTKWQLAAIEKEKPQQRLILMSRVGSWGGSRLCYLNHQNLPAITASLGDDGKGGNGRRHMWTVYDQESGLTQNVKVSGFAALMGVPKSFIFTGNPRRDIRAIGNGVIPWALNDLVLRSALV